MSVQPLLRQVAADLAQGHTYLAGLRLAALTSTFPDDLDFRARRGRLAHQIGNFAEAGRWSYLTEDADPRDIAAFENMFKRPRQQLSVLKLRTDPVEGLGPVARARLEGLIERARADTGDDVPFVAPEAPPALGWRSWLPGIGCGLLLIVGVAALLGLAMYGFIALWKLA